MCHVHLQCVAVSTFLRESECFAQHRFFPHSHEYSYLFKGRNLSYEYCTNNSVILSFQALIDSEFPGTFSLFVGFYPEV